MTFNSSYRKFFPIAIISLAALIYSNSLTAEFQYDDHFFIVDNPAIRDVTNVRAVWKAMPFPSRFVAFYTFALNYHCHGLDVFGYHVFNLFIHIVTALSVWWLARQLLILKNHAGLTKDQEVIALFSSLLFLAHPVQTQAVAYITQRFASLATMFYVSSLCFYICARRTKMPWPKTIFFAVSGILGLLGMFTKEIVITLPLMILFTEFFLIGPALNTAQKRPALSLQKTIFIVFILSFMVVIPIAFRGQVAATLFEERLSESHFGDIYQFHTYLLTQLRVFAKFIQLLILPVNLNVNYDFPMSRSLLEIKTLLSFLFLSAVILLTLKIRKQHPLIAFGVFWFFITLSANLVPRRHVIFEHKLYLASIGPCITACLVLFQSIKDRQKCMIVTCSLIFIFAILAHKRNEVWKTEIALWEDTAKKSPQKLQVINNLGKVYLDEGLDAKAFRQFEKALQIYPDYVSALNNRGFMYKKEEKWELALADFNRAIRNKPNKDDIYVNRGEVYKELGEMDLALADFEKAIEMNPESYPAYNARGTLYGLQKNYDRALLDFLQTIRINPHHAPAHNNLGLAYKLLGDSDKALQYLNKSILLNDNNPEYYLNRGNVYEAKKFFDQALKDYTKVVSLDPSHVKGYNNRAVLYGKAGHYALAAKDLENALRLDPDYAEAHNNLGLILKNTGQFDAAVDRFNKAILVSPHYGSAYYNRGLTRQLMGQYALALDDFTLAQKYGRPVNKEIIKLLEANLKNEK